MATPMKSMCMISTTGRRPQAAAPTGVSYYRSLAYGRIHDAPGAELGPETLVLAEISAAKADVLSGEIYFGGSGAFRCAVRRLSPWRK